MTSNDDLLTRVYLFVMAHRQNLDFDLTKKADATAFVQKYAKEMNKAVPQGTKQITIVTAILELAIKNVFDSEVRAAEVLPAWFMQGQSLQDRPVTRSQTQTRAGQSTIERTRTDGQDPRGSIKRVKCASSDDLQLSASGQYTVLHMTQDILEQCCFDFAKAWIPEVLDQNKWSCSVSVELTHWEKILGDAFRYLPINATTVKSASELRDVLAGVAQVRHSAVHRLPLHAAMAEQLLRNSVQVALALKDDARAARLEVIHGHVLEAVKTLRSLRDTHQTNLDAKKRQINDEIVRLEAQRREAERDMYLRNESATERVSSEMLAALAESMRGFTASSAAYSMAMVPFRGKP